MFLSALATLNFSLSFLIGICASPLSFVRPVRKRVPETFWSRNRKAVSGVVSVLLVGINPVVLIRAATHYWGKDIVEVLVQAAEGWHIWGLWTQVVVWLVWWPAWFAGSVVVAEGFFS